MKKSNRIKHWRLNLLVTYFTQTSSNCYRFDILQLLKHLSSLYKLDYAISVDHQFSSDSDSSEQFTHKSITDLVYFRSNKNSLVDAKELRSIIGCMFHTKHSLFYGTVDIYTQLYKVLTQYPFPNEFYRPLDYPFVEFHRGSQITLYIFADEVMKVIEKEQDFHLN